MSIFNRRNAVVGWLSWLVAKQVLRKKARDVVPGQVERSRRPIMGMVAGALAAVGGLIWFWRRSSSGDELPPPAGE
jgi:hypothetical protein